MTPELHSRMRALRRRWRPCPRGWRSASPSPSAMQAAVAGRIGGLEAEHRDAGAVVEAAAAARRACSLAAAAYRRRARARRPRAARAPRARRARRRRCRAAAPARRPWQPAPCASASARTASMSGPTTTDRASAPSCCATASTWPSIERPAILCSTLGSADFMRVPLPAARTTTSRGRRLIKLSLFMDGDGAAGPNLDGRAELTRRSTRYACSSIPRLAGPQQGGNNVSVELRIGLHNMLLSRHMPSNYLVTYQSLTWVADAIHRHRYGCPSAVVAPCAQLHRISASDFRADRRGDRPA